MHFENCLHYLIKCWWVIGTVSKHFGLETTFKKMCKLIVWVLLLLLFSHLICLLASLLALCIIWAYIKSLPCCHWKHWHYSHWNTFTTKTSKHTVHSRRIKPTFLHFPECSTPSRTPPFPLPNFGCVDFLFCSDLIAWTQLCDLGRTHLTLHHHHRPSSSSSSSTDQTAVFI